jgi:hypothetical protein
MSRRGYNPFAPLPGSSLDPYRGDQCIYRSAPAAGNHGPAIYKLVVRGLRPSSSLNYRSELMNAAIAGSVTGRTMQAIMAVLAVIRLQ